MVERYHTHVTILGAGPAGLTAGLYSARAKLKTAVLDTKIPGGQMLLTEHILNYPGFPDGVSGHQLTQLFRTQAEQYDCIVKERVGAVSLSFEKNQFHIKAPDIETVSESIIIATGCSPRRLNVPGEKKLSGRGISYCAVCDANFFEDLDVMVVGGGDAALEEAAYLSRICRSVTVVHRRDKFRASEACQCLIRDCRNIKVVMNATVECFQGDDLLEWVRLVSTVSGKRSDLAVSGAFVYVGQIPNSAFLPDAIERDPSGWVITDDCLATSAAGIFAAGDVRRKVGRQVSTAVGDGALSAISAEKFIMMKSCRI